METVNIRYVFRFPDERQEVFDLHLDAETLELIHTIPETLPSWTRIGFYQCPNCVLTPETHSYCPVAIHLVKVMAICNDVLSYDSIHVDIFTYERVVYKDTSVQKGISSLMGLIIATSGCPHTGFFKPMARFHLPLASAEETIYRAASMYLLAQYFRHKQGQEADLEMTGLMRIYQDIEVINKSMAQRLLTISDKDSMLNALNILDIFAKSLPFAVEESLQEIRYLFSPYFPQLGEGSKRGKSY